MMIFGGTENSTCPFASPRKRKQSKKCMGFLNIRDRADKKIIKLN